LEQTPVTQVWDAEHVWVAWPHVPQQSGLAQTRVVLGTHWHAPHV